MLALRATLGYAGTWLLHCPVQGPCVSCSGKPWRRKARVTPVDILGVEALVPGELSKYFEESYPDGEIYEGSKFLSPALGSYSRSLIRHRTG